MRFGAHLAEVRDPKWCSSYIDYDGLKDHLKVMLQTKELGNDTTELENAFSAFVERELEKVSSFQAAKAGELKCRVQQCSHALENYTKAFGKVTSSTAASEAGNENAAAGPLVLDSTEEGHIISELENEISVISEDTSSLSRFCLLNQTGFQKILKKHDKHFPIHNLSARFTDRIVSGKHFGAPLQPLILCLSSLCHALRARNDPGATAVAAKVEAGMMQSFVRQTKKYWVHLDNVTEVKLKVLRHLPVLVHGSSADDHDPAVASVYLDNEEFSLYRGRIERSEGAQAIRLRWYGRRNRGGADVYVERKTHREDWTGEKSVKERFALKAKHVASFLSKPFNPEDTEDLVSKFFEKQKARGHLSAEDYEQVVSLAREVHETVHQRALKPVIRTFYNRTAFQVPGDAKVRISLDTELCMIREGPTISSSNRSAMVQVDPSETDSNCSSWRRPDLGPDSAWPFSGIPAQDICRFPYAILEVKLQSQLGARPPAWVTALTESALVEEVPKFSKFLHGCAELYSNSVPLIPYWLPQMLAVDIRNTRLSKTRSEERHAAVDNNNPSVNVTPCSDNDRRSRDTVINIPTRVGCRRPRSTKSKFLFVARTRRNNHNMKTSSEASSRSSRSSRHTVDLQSELGESLRTLPSPTASQVEDLECHSPGSRLSYQTDSNENTPLLPRHSSRRRRDRVTSRWRFKEKFRNILRWLSPRQSQLAPGDQYTAPPPSVPSVLVPEGRRPGLLRRLCNFMRRRRTACPQRSRRIAVPVRVEPKVYFANERTFLSWLHFSTLVGGFAVNFMNFSDKAGKISGGVFVGVSILVALYALGVYMWRARMIRKRAGGPYDDLFGPVCVVVILVTIFIVLFLFRLQQFLM